MFAKRWLIVFILAGLTFLFAYETYRVWSPAPAPLADATPGQARGDRINSPRVERRVPPVSQFAAIVQKNLFSADRKESVQGGPTTPAARAAAPNRTVQNIALFGVVLRAGEKSALVLNVRETLWVKVGDKIGSVTVEQIENDRIVVKEGGQSFEILLDDRTSPAKRVTPPQAQKPQEPVVITTGSGRPGTPPSKPPKTN